MTRPLIAARRSRLVSVLIASAGIVILIGAERRLSSGPMEPLKALFQVWPFVPFVLAMAGVWRRGASLERCVGLAVSSGFGLVLYAALLLGAKPSPTTGLALIFIPLWQIAGCATVIAVTNGG